MAEIVKVVDPDSGSGYNYDSLYDWEAGEQQDLTDGGGDIAVAKCRCTGGTADTTGFTVDGWTTSETCYIKIWTDPSESYRHAGTYPSGNKYRIEIGTSSVTLSDPYVKIFGIAQAATGGADAIVIIEDFIDIAYCVLKGASGGSEAIYCNTSGTYDCRIYNNIIYDHERGIWQRHSSSYRFSYYNNTFQNCSVAGLADASLGTDGYGTAINNLFVSCQSNAVGTFATGTDYNATDDASIGYTVNGGGNTHDRVNQTFTFIDANNDNFHLASNDGGARDYGKSDPGSGLFSDDIDGQTRSGSWDIGADEYVAASTNYPRATGGALSFGSQSGRAFVGKRGIGGAV